MIDETPFLNDLMRNSIHQYLVVDISDLPPKEYWWEFEEKCLGEHFGLSSSTYDEWWNIWIEDCNSNFVLLEVKVVSNYYEISYKIEETNIEDLYGYGYGSPSSYNILAFKDIYNKYLLPEGQELNKPPHILSQEELDELLDIAEQGVTTDMYINEQRGEDNSAQKLEEAFEEIEVLNSTIKDMEEIIKTLKANLTFTWSMLEIKIKESK